MNRDQQTNSAGESAGRESSGHGDGLESGLEPGPIDGASSIPERELKTGFVRWLLLVLGVLFTALGAAGAFLPVLPTTPFLLLATACFVRSSPSLHRRLLANRMFGSYLAQWNRDHTVPREAKRQALGLVIVTFTISIAMGGETWLRLTLAGVGLALIAFLASLRTTSVPLPDSSRKPSETK